MRKNALWMAAYEIFVYICPLITAPYIARILGTYGTGVYTYTFSIVSYFIVLTQLGVNLYGRREIASCKNLAERSNTFWNIWLVETIMFVISSTIYFIFIFQKESNMEFAFKIQYFSLLGAWLDISWLFFGIENFKLAVSRNIIVKVLSLILIFVFINDKNDVDLYVFLMAFSSFISVIVMWISVPKYISLIRIEDVSLKIHLLPMFQMFIPVLSTQLFSMTDKVFLGWLSDVDAVGLYENAYKVSRVPVALITTIGTVLLPRITKLYAEKREKEADRYFDKSLSLTLFIGIGSSFGLIGIAKSFIPIYLGNQFLASTPILQILSLVLVAIAFGNPFRTQFILPKKMDSLYVRTVVYAAVLNIVLNLILIPKWSMVGAAIASVTSEFLIIIYQSFKIKDSFNFKQIILKNIKYLAAGLIMLILVLALQIILPSNMILSLLLQILIGAISYISLVILFEKVSHDSVVTNEINKFLSLVKSVVIKIDENNN